MRLPTVACSRLYPLSCALPTFLSRIRRFVPRHSSGPEYQFPQAGQLVETLASPTAATYATGASDAPRMLGSGNARMCSSSRRPLNGVAVIKHIEITRLAQGTLDRDLRLHAVARDAHRERMLRLL